MTLLSSTFAGENESVSCPDAPTGYVETTPYSTMTISLMANGKPAIGLFEYYKSVTFVEDCDGTYISFHFYPNIHQFYFLIKHKFLTNLLLFFYVFLWDIEFC